MNVVHTGLVHFDPCECKVKDFCAVSYIKRNVSKKHLQGMQHTITDVTYLNTDSTLKTNTKY